MKTPLGSMGENKNFSLSGKQKMLAISYFMHGRHIFTRFAEFL